MGINSSKIQQRLLAEKDLTLDKAVDLALGMEAATRMSRSWHKVKPPL